MIYTHVLNKGGRGVISPLGHFNCINHLTPDLVWQKIQQIIA
jgi:hypothetical protein